MCSKSPLKIRAGIRVPGGVFQPGQTTEQFVHQRPLLWSHYGLLRSWMLPRPAARCHSDKDAYTQRDRDGDERTPFCFPRNLVQGGGCVPSRIFPVPGHPCGALTQVWRFCSSSDCRSRLAEVMMRPTTEATYSMCTRAPLQRRLSERI
jgi:hypothetical protein